jgi:hypothetical protein
MPSSTWESVMFEESMLDLDWSGGRAVVAEAMCSDTRALRGDCIVEPIELGGRGNRFVGLVLDVLDDACGGVPFTGLAGSGLVT